VVLGEPGATAPEHDLGGRSAAEMDRALAATDPAAPGEWRLLGAAALGPGAGEAAPPIRRVGREALSGTAGEPHAVRVEGARWWSPPAPWRADPFHADGRLRHPSDHPFVDRRLSAGQAELVVERDLSLAREPYLADHQLDATPVVPGAVHVEALAGAAMLLRPDEGLREVRDFAVPLMVRVAPGAILPLRAAARGGRSGVETRLLSDFVDPRGQRLVRDRLHAHARVELGEPHPPEAWEGAGPVLPWLPRGGSDMSTCYLDSDQRTLGPRFHSLRWIRVFGSSEVLGRIEPPPGALLGHTRVPRFRIDPIRLDACFQAAALLAVWRFGMASVPAGFDLLRVYGAPQEDRPLYVHARLDPASGERARYDMDVFDGSGRMVWRIRGYTEHVLFPLPPRNVRKVEDLVEASHVAAPLLAGDGESA
jgi:hypothetical protein